MVALSGTSPPAWSPLSHLRQAHRAHESRFMAAHEQEHSSYRSGHDGVLAPCSSSGCMQDSGARAAPAVPRSTCAAAPAPPWAACTRRAAAATAQSPWHRLRHTCGAVQEEGVGRPGAGRPATNAVFACRRAGQPRGCLPCCPPPAAGPPARLALPPEPASMRGAPDRVSQGGVSKSRGAYRISINMSLGVTACRNRTGASRQAGGWVGGKAGAAAAVLALVAGLPGTPMAGRQPAVVGPRGGRCGEGGPGPRLGPGQSIPDVPFLPAGGCNVRHLYRRQYQLPAHLLLQVQLLPEGVRQPPRQQQVGHDAS